MTPAMPGKPVPDSQASRISSVPGGARNGLLRSFWRCLESRAMGTYKRIIHYSKPYWWQIAISMAASFAVGGTDAAIAYLMEPLLKKIFTEKEMTIFILLPVAVIVVFLFRGVARFLQEYYIRVSGQLAIQDIRNELYRKHMGLSLRYFSANPAGVLISRIMSDVGQMQQGVANVVTGLLRKEFKRRRGVDGYGRRVLR
ncbi:hypothetical protein EG829_24020 [bacterium]|nr:hypothetical protein [bacterium]